MKCNLKIGWVLLAIAMAICLALPGLAAQNQSGHWAADALVLWQDRGVMKGDEHGSLNPDTPATRGELAAMLHAIMDYQTINPNCYHDVETDSWYTEPVLKATAAGLFSGYPDGTMKPDHFLTRQEAMVVLSNVLDLDVEHAPSAPYADASLIASWASPCVNAMHAKGYITGDENGFFLPEAPITRAELGSIFSRMFHSYVSQAGTYTEHVDGNMVVSSGDVILEGQTISGDLILSEGAANGTVTLNHVTVCGRVLVRAHNSTIHIQGDTRLGEVITQASNVAVICTNTTETSPDDNENTPSEGGSSSPGDNSNTTQSITVTPENVVHQLNRSCNTAQLTVTFSEGDYASLDGQTILFYGTELNLNLSAVKGICQASFTLNAPNATTIHITDGGSGERGAQFTGLTIHAPQAHVENSVAFHNVVVESVADTTFQVLDQIVNLLLMEGSVAVAQEAEEVKVLIPADATGATQVDGVIRQLEIQCPQYPVMVEAQVEHLNITAEPEGSGNHRAPVKVLNRVEHLQVDTKAWIESRSETWIANLQVGKSADHTILTGGGIVVHSEIQSQTTLALDRMDCIRASASITVEGSTVIDCIHVAWKDGTIFLTVNDTASVNRVVVDEGSVEIGGNSTHQKEDVLVWILDVSLTGSVGAYTEGDPTLDFGTLTLHVTYSDQTTREVPILGNGDVDVDYGPLFSAQAGETVHVAITYAGYTLTVPVAVEGPLQPEPQPPSEVEKVLEAIQDLFQGASLSVCEDVTDVNAQVSQFIWDKLGLLPLESSYEITVDNLTEQTDAPGLWTADIRVTSDDDPIGASVSISIAVTRTPVEGDIMLPQDESQWNHAPQGIFTIHSGETATIRNTYVIPAGKILYVEDGGMLTVDGMVQAAADTISRGELRFAEGALLYETANANYDGAVVREVGSLLEQEAITAPYNRFAVEHTTQWSSSIQLADGQYIEVEDGATLNATASAAMALVDGAACGGLHIQPGGRVVNQTRFLIHSGELIIDTDPQDDHNTALVVQDNGQNSGSETLVFGQGVQISGTGALAAGLYGTITDQIYLFRGDAWTAAVLQSNAAHPIYYSSLDDFLADPNRNPADPAYLLGDLSLTRQGRSILDCPLYLQGHTLTIAANCALALTNSIDCGAGGQIVGQDAAQLLLSERTVYPHGDQELSHGIFTWRNGTWTDGEGSGDITLTWEDEMLQYETLEEALVAAGQLPPSPASPIVITLGADSTYTEIPGLLSGLPVYTTLELNHHTLTVTAGSLLQGRKGSHIQVNGTLINHGTIRVFSGRMVIAPGGILENYGALHPEEGILLEKGGTLHNYGTVREGALIIRGEFVNHENARYLYESSNIVDIAEALKNPYVTELRLADAQESAVLSGLTTVGHNGSLAVNVPLDLGNCNLSITDGGLLTINSTVTNGTDQQNQPTHILGSSAEDTLVIGPHGIYFHNHLPLTPGVYTWQNGTWTADPQAPATLERPFTLRNPEEGTSVFSSIESALAAVNASMDPNQVYAHQDFQYAGKLGSGNAYIELNLNGATMTIPAHQNLEIVYGSVSYSPLMALGTVRGSEGSTVTVHKGSTFLDFEAATQTCIYAWDTTTEQWVLSQPN